MTILKYIKKGGIMTTENVIDFTFTNWVTVVAMAVGGFFVAGIGVAIFTKYINPKINKSNNEVENGS